jgi:hypothetical protein
VPFADTVVLPVTSSKTARKSIRLKMVVVRHLVVLNALKPIVNVAAA